MGKIIHRLFELKLPKNRSAFLWGPRKVGKSYWIAHHLPQATVIDFLETDTFAEYATQPALLRERYQNHQGLLVIDEVQKVPHLLNEVHWLMEKKGIQFLLTGSSARKLKRGQANLLGGRAWRRVMQPLTLAEVSGFDLEKVMQSGLLPPHFLSIDPIEDLRAYVADYLKEEIAAEALTQNLPAFADFLHVAALHSSELINYTNIARESGVSAKVVRTYFTILEDTYLGFRLAPWKRSKNRRLIETEKFYLFDIGVTNFLARRVAKLGSAEFGKSFEQYLLMELKAYQAYHNPELPITFWRSSTGYEVDFILGDKALAIEVKAKKQIHQTDLAGLKALKEDSSVKNSVIVCLEKQPRQLTAGIEVLPWKLFLEKLWAGDFNLN